MKTVTMEQYSPEEQQQIRERSRKTLLAIGIVSMIMLFAGLTSAYIVRQGEGNWATYELPLAFTYSTIMIVGASITIHLAYLNIRKGARTMAVRLLWITLLLGIGFSLSQFMGWSTLTTEGVYFVGNPSGSFLYVLTGLHLAHLAGGLLYLVYVIAKTPAERSVKDDVLRVNLCMIYWHFLDLLWIYLFLFLLFIR